VRLVSMKRPFEGSKLCNLVNDLMRKRVLYVAEDRKQSSLDGFWETLTPEQISGIEAVAMDMWTVRRFGTGTSAGSGWQDRFRQVSCGPAFG